MKIALRYSGPPGRRVELFGNFPSWKRARPLIETSPGEYLVELDIAPGVYEYKFRIDGEHWVADPRAPLDPLEATGNSQLIAGGSTPPYYFAPDRKHVGRPPGCELRFETDAALPCPGGAIEVLIRHGRRLCRSKFERGAQKIQLGPHNFALPPYTEFPCPAPEWLANAVFYSIFVDRWRGPRTGRSTAETWFGGDLPAITASLDELAELGTTALLLTPIVPARSPHRYDVVDLFAVDPALGGEPALRQLLEEAHARGMRVVLDAPLTHVSASHPAFVEVLARGDVSPYASWFRRKPDPGDAGAIIFDHYYDHPELPWLELRDPGARAHAIASVLRLLALGADGVRLDAMDEAPDDFWIELAARVRAEHRAHPSSKNCGFLLLGEVVIDNLAHYAEERGADCVTDFKHRETVLDFFARARIDAQEFWSRLVAEEHRAGAFEPAFRLLFLDNHDTARFRSLAITHDKLRLALAYLYFRPEPIALTYGTELGMAGGAHAEERDGVWSERMPMPPRAAMPRTETRALMIALAAIRRAVYAAHGDARLELVTARDRLIAIKRGRHVLVINAGATVQPGELPGARAARTLLSVNGCSDEPAGLLPAFTARFLLLPE